MNFSKKIIRHKSFKNYISLFGMLFLMNNLIAFGSDNKSTYLLSKQKNSDLEEIFKLNEISFSESDNLNNQLKTFFGLYSSESNTNSYPEFSIIKISEALREGYILKLKDMTVNKTNYKINKDGYF